MFNFAQSYHHRQLHGFFIQLDPPSESPFLQLNFSLLSSNMGSDIIDHSPNQAKPLPQIPTASKVILIDNYDSFTWNIYQYLHLAGGSPVVLRNDEVTVDELVAQKPTHIVISPGPGHPEHDSGVSRDVIRHFAGKIPIFGVCMGL